MLDDERWTILWRDAGDYSLFWEASQAVLLRCDAWVSHASCTTSASARRVSSPIRLARSSTEPWPSKCRVVKNGDAGSWTSACFSDSDVSVHWSASCIVRGLDSTAGVVATGGVPSRK